MSSETAISVANLSKCYHIYDKPRDRLLQMLMLGRKRFYREFWALKDVSFEVQRGQCVGIIGCNGSGKSTLLQLICGTLNPNAGTIGIHGRVAALLELGAGFNPDFTGRENVYLNAAILGLMPAEIDARYASIVAFAGIGDFINQPIKSYSTGMMVRLAFAVAISVEPDILVVDEALGVGDELFQRQCFSRIEMIRRRGSTILFVSHSASQVVELCDRAMLLDGGELLAMGGPRQIVGHYQKMLFAPAEKRAEIRDLIRREFRDSSVVPVADASSVSRQAVPEAEREHFDPHLKPRETLEYASHGVSIATPVVLNAAGETVNGLIRGRAYRYRFCAKFAQSASNVRFGMSVRTPKGLALCGAHSVPSLSEALPTVAAAETVEVTFAFTCHLNPGLYFLNAGVFGFEGESETVLNRKVDVAVFRVLPVEQNVETGPVSLDVKPAVRKLPTLEQRKMD